ncbi:MAG: hypothetical protein AAGG51_08100 [Cyanobacteria bacterium P01_G01_bin.54]
MTSEISQKDIHLKGLEPSHLKECLCELLDEEYNRDNDKRLKSVTVGVPVDILQRIDLADVPGFTVGNKRQQSLAERYSTQRADLALVLLNDHDTVEIRGTGGLDGIANCFKNRLKSTIFIMNKADKDPSLRHFKSLKQRFIGKIKDYEVDASDARIYSVSAHKVQGKRKKKWMEVW